MFAGGSTFASVGSDDSVGSVERKGSSGIARPIGGVLPTGSQNLVRSTGSVGAGGSSSSVGSAEAMSSEDAVISCCIEYSGAVFPWLGKKLYEMIRAFGLGTALIPLEGYGDWAAAAVVGGFLVTPLYKGVDELVNKEQDVRVILRAEVASRNGNAVAGFAKIFGKHILAPVIPVSIAVIGIAGPEKDLGHPYAHGLVHAGLGCLIYLMCAALAENKWPAADPDVKPVPLSEKSRQIQKYIAEPLLAGFPRTVLMAEFLRRTIFEYILEKETHALHAPVIYGMLCFSYYHWRSLTQEKRQIQEEVNFSNSALLLDQSELKHAQIEENVAITVTDPRNTILGINSFLSTSAQQVNNNDQPEEVQEEKISRRQKIEQKAWKYFKEFIKYSSCFAANAIHSAVVGSEHDNDLGERTQRYAAIATGLYVVSGTIEGAEALWKNRSTLFGRRAVNIPQARSSLLASEPSLTPSQNQRF